MSAPPFLASPPALPPGWTQHLGPAGQLYYHNAQTKESTYMRPVPSFVAPSAPQPEQPKKREKAHLKTPVPGTDWLRVTTTEGNIFYSNKATKQSSWTIPPEIEAAVTSLEKQESGYPTAPDTGKGQKKPTKEGKRKRDDEQIMPLDELVTKKAKIEEGEEEEEDDSSDEDSDDEEEEEWQREAAEQLAREAEEERIRQGEEAKRREEEERKAKEEEEKARAMPKLSMPDKVELSLEEGKALFKTLLREKDINPLHPWDLCLPKFINDPRYVLLPSVAARKEAFDEYCRERARELRESAVKKEKKEANPKEDFDSLLRDEVKSTRASWTDFRRTWKKDRRFYGWGRDDKEREKAFRDFLKALGEKKRAAAQKAEADFFALLKERPEIKPGSVWKDVKRALYSDPRYDAVGSSTLREELFNTYLKGVGTLASNNQNDGELAGPNPPERESREARRERALREREHKVKVEQNKVSVAIEKTRTGMNLEEGERLFKTMLVDAIRDPQSNWDAAVDQLKIDPRFTNSPLSYNQQVKLFHEHIDHLRSRHLGALHQLFEEKTPSLDSRFSDLPIDEIYTAPNVSRLGCDIRQLEDEFGRWQRTRGTEARKAFEEMVRENTFVEFWGRLSKMSDVKLDQGLQVANEDIGEEDEEENKVDMKALAKTVDIGEMVKVLKRDRRYTIFDHIPEDRERWLRDYLSNMSAPKLSVHVP